MKILVTGGAGFIGSALVPFLSKEKHDVYVIDNLSFGNRGFIDIPDDHFFKIDIRNTEKVDETLSNIKPEIVIHLAALHFIPYCNQHPYEAAEVNIKGTINVLQACKKNMQLKRLLFASTAAVYPISENAINESNELLPLDIYGLSKLTGEHLCREFWFEKKIDIIICRFFNAFGPNETNPHLIPEIEKQLREGNRTIKLGNLTPKRDFIHTYDMASAIIMLLKMKNIGYEIFNLGRGIEYSVVDIVEAFERQLNEKIVIKVDPDKVRKVEREHLLADISKLKGATGWKPKWSIDEGIKDIITNWKNL